MNEDNNKENTYPLFEFTVDGFRQLKKYLNEIESIEQKIEFINFYIEKYDDQVTSFFSLQIDYYLLLKFELDYWVYCYDVIRKIELPKQSINEDSFLSALWVDNFINNCVFRIFFHKNELFEFDINKINEYSATLGSITNQIFYFRFVIKEFKIQIALFPNTYTYQQTSDFENNILNKYNSLIKTIKDNEDILRRYYMKLKNIFDSKKKRQPIKNDTDIYELQLNKIDNEIEDAVSMLERLKEDDNMVVLTPVMSGGYLLMIGNNFAKHGWIINQPELEKLYELTEKYHKKNKSIN